MSVPSSEADRAFVRTRWSTITEMSPTGDPAPTEALALLCARYRYPVYAYLRGCGYAPALALDALGRFLDDVQVRFGDERPPTTRRFRRFLLARLEAHLALGPQEHRGLSIDPPDSFGPLEARYERDAIHHDSPEQAFARAFAIDVLLGAFARLRDEAEAAGHGAMYAALAPFLARDPRADESDALARTLNARPLTVAVALKRLRQRLRELSARELADTVSSADELASEQAAMFTALGGAG